MSKINHEDAFTGLEAAIVLIAFVVVAAVFSYVVLGAGFFTTQKAQETVYQGVAQASSNLEVVGNVYGTGSTTYHNITQVDFTVQLAAGAPSIDLNKTTLMFSTPTSAPVRLELVSGVTPDTTHFAIITGDTNSDSSLSKGEQIQIGVKVPDNANITGYGEFTLEIRPPVGSPYSLHRTAPATIEVTNILN